MSGTIAVQRQIVGAGLATFPDCVVEEVGVDTLQITEHPVEGPVQGVVNDHAFKKPREVTLQWSWSDSSDTNHGAAQGVVLEIYNDLLSLQSSLTLFTIYTGKSAYTDMLMQSLKQTTTKDSEFSLQITAVCRQIIIVSTYNTDITTSTPSNASNMSNPSATAPVVQTGQSNVVPTASSASPSVNSFAFQGGAP